jgi:CelD/BcsL family acetyltransferase involved in cellulose biosynthesis
MEVSPLDVRSSMDRHPDRKSWTDLARSSTNIFSTWEWAQVWSRHFGSRRVIELARVMDADGLTVAVLPLLRERRAAFRVMRFVGHGVADELGPVCAAHNRTAATEALGAVSTDGDVLLAERLPADWPRGPLGGQVLKQESSPVISLGGEGGWEDYLRTRSANFRQQVRRRARKLERGLEIRYRLAQDPSRLQADLDSLFALHQARWGTSSRAFAGRREAFHREFAALAQQRGWLRLWLAESQGQPVAAWYGFRFAGVESFYQSGRDPEWDRFAVGAGILEHSIREAFHDGMREYRLLRGDEPYKRRYATKMTGVVTLAVPRGLGARALVAAAAVLARRPGGRRLLTSVNR